MEKTEEGEGGEVDGDSLTMGLCLCFGLFAQGNRWDWAGTRAAGGQQEQAGRRRRAGTGRSRQEAAGRPEETRDGQTTDKRLVGEARRCAALLAVYFAWLARVTASTVYRHGAMQGGRRARGRAGAAPVPGTRARAHLPAPAARTGYGPGAVAATRCAPRALHGWLCCRAAAARARGCLPRGAARGAAATRRERCIESCNKPGGLLRRTAGQGRWPGNAPGAAAAGPPGWRALALVAWSARMYRYRARKRARTSPRVPR